MAQLDGKVAVITGGNRGIGKGIAKLFAEEGANLAICGRDAAKLEETAEELRQTGREVFAQRVDVSVESDVLAFFEGIARKYDRIDILVNNAGSFNGGRIDRIELDAWNNVIGACLTGTFLCSRSAFAVMKKQGGGRILNIGSISAQRPRAHHSPYAAAKFGVWGLTQSIALDGRPHGILCSCLHPGNVRVERRIGARSEEEPMMTTETIAKAALAMVALPDDVNFLEAIVLPKDQTYLARG